MEIGRSVSAGKIIVFVVAMLSISSDLCTEKQTKEVIVGSAHITGRYVGIQENDADATIHNPGVFEGKQTLKLDRGSGLSLAIGVLQVEISLFDGLEMEWLVNSSEIFTTGYWDCIFSQQLRRHRAYRRKPMLLQRGGSS